MWTITDKQLDNISKSMRTEFEKRAFFVLSKEKCTDSFLEDEIKQNITEQMNQIIESGIIDEDEAIQFIRLSFEEPNSQEKEWDTLSNNTIIEI